MKKTWISIKRGLLRPEHRESLGVRVWLFMHMIDICDWDTGQIKGWTDKSQAEKIEMPWRTVQRQRQELADAGYITCDPGFQCLNITIAKWVNPRSYSGEKVTQGGTQKRVGGTQNCVPILPENCVPLLIDQIFNQYGVELPKELQHEDFCDAWEAWEKHRREIKKKLTPTSVNRQLKLLARHSPYAVAMIEKSVLNGWTGLFEPDERMLKNPVTAKKEIKPGKAGGINL